VFVTLGGVVQKPGEAYVIEGENEGLVVPRIVFTEAPLEGTSCDVRVVTSDDGGDTMVVTELALTPDFDGTTTYFEVSPSNKTFSNLNSFIFLWGIEQNPFGLGQTSAAYTATYDPTLGTSSVSFLGGAPDAGTTLDARAIYSSSRYVDVGISSVFVSSTDDIAPLFNSATRTFNLEIDGVSLDPTKVNAQNMFVSLGGVMQIPVAQEGDPLAGNAYVVAFNPSTQSLEITFAVPPAIGTTCNIRIVTSEEYLTCPNLLGEGNIIVGPGVLVNDQNQIIQIDPGTISG
jgi:hypothetical protein